MQNALKVVESALEKDELVFVLRSLDPMSLYALRKYWEQAKLTFGTLHEYTEEIKELIIEWDRWQDDNRRLLQHPKRINDTDILHTPFQKKDRCWSAYPLGTKAHAYNGGYWLRVLEGWRWCSGDTFPIPGGDAMGDCIEMPEVYESHER